MLTVTYALISLSVEQRRVHNLLSTLQQLFQKGSACTQYTDPVISESIVTQLAKLDASCRRRKVEVYVIPAIQEATKEAGALLAELEWFSAMGLHILGSIRDCVRQVLDQAVLEASELYALIESYCNNLLRRLAKEEEELLPLAQRIISGDEWFVLGVKFLSLDAEFQARQPSGASQYAEAIHFFEKSGFSAHPVDAAPPCRTESGG